MLDAVSVVVVKQERKMMELEEPASSFLQPLAC